MPLPAKSESIRAYCSQYLQDRSIPLLIVTDWANQLHHQLQSPKPLRPGKIARLLQMEPCIAAHLIQLANSPLYRGRRMIDSASAALHHLGLETTQNLVSALIAKAFYQIQNPILQKKLHSWWEHSCHVAIISGLLAQKTPGFDPDRALLAGLLHDIGMVPILIYADSMPESPDLDELREAEQTLSRPIGVEIARRWHLPDDFAEVINHAEHWQRDDNQHASYSDLVMIAQLHSYIGKAKGLPKMDDLAAYRKIAAGKLDIKLSIQILDQAREEWEYLKTLIQ